MSLVALPLWQLTGIVLAVVSAVAMGIIVGFIVSRLGSKEAPYDDKEEFIISE
jgi:hypothetical protein